MNAGQNASGARQPRRRHRVGFPGLVSTREPVPTYSRVLPPFVSLRGYTSACCRLATSGGLRKKALKHTAYTVWRSDTPRRVCRRLRCGWRHAARPWPCDALQLPRDWQRELPRDWQRELPRDWQRDRPNSAALVGAAAASPPLEYGRLQVSCTVQRHLAPGCHELASAGAGLPVPSVSFRPRSAAKAARPFSAPAQGRYVLSCRPPCRLWERHAAKARCSSTHSDPSLTPYRRHSPRPTHRAAVRSPASCATTLCLVGSAAPRALQSQSQSPSPRRRPGPGTSGAFVAIESLAPRKATRQDDLDDGLDVVASALQRRGMQAPMAEEERRQRRPQRTQATATAAATTATAAQRYRRRPERRGGSRHNAAAPTEAHLSRARAHRELVRAAAGRTPLQWLMVQTR